MKRLSLKSPKALPLLPPETKPLELSGRRTPELVLAFVGAAGSGVTAAADAFAKKLREEFAYEPHPVRVSDLIKVQAEKLGKPIKIGDKKSVQIRQMQDVGKAFSAAANSACLSRQVGAAAYSNEGEMLGVGWNDVPRFGGGLYAPEDGTNDNRCFRWGGKICHNDSRKDKLNEQIVEELRKANVLKNEATDFEVISALKLTDIKSLIEYSRSVHAEMAAILSVARAGERGLVEGTLYVTTFPCHSCARQIVAAGISRVVYIEPYPKSLATELHRDSLFSGFAEHKQSKVQFVPYEGVAPRNIYRLFKHGIERKENGKAKTQGRKTAEPVTRPPLDGFTVFEQVVVKELTAAAK